MEETKKGYWKKFAIGGSVIIGGVVAYVIMTKAIDIKWFKDGLSTTDFVEALKKFEELKELGNAVMFFENGVYNIMNL